MGDVGGWEIFKLQRDMSRMGQVKINGPSFAFYLHGWIIAY